MTLQESPRQSGKLFNPSELAVEQLNGMKKPNVQFTVTSAHLCSLGICGSLINRAIIQKFLHLIFPDKMVSRVKRIVPVTAQYYLTLQTFKHVHNFIHVSSPIPLSPDTTSSCEWVDLPASREPHWLHRDFTQAETPAHVYELGACRFGALGVQSCTSYQGITLES